jgi:hypothetical protein
LVLGCTFTGATAFARGTKTASGSIVAFTRVSGLSSSNAVSSLAVSENVTGAVFAQNIVEYTLSASGPSYRVTSDGSTGNATHIILHNNTFLGFFANGRNNLFYDDGATPRTSKLLSLRGNIHVQINTKGDIFVTDGARVGNWAYLYGVGCQGEISQFIDADNAGLGTAFAQAFPGIGANIGTGNSTRNDPLFVDYEGTTSGPTAGAGGGDYALQTGSPAAGIVTSPPLRFDAAGLERNASASAAGAYRGFAETA